MNNFGENNIINIYTGKRQQETAPLRVETGLCQPGDITWRKMKAASSFAVRTRAYKFMKDVLETDGHVFVHGPPGSGKTTLSLVLMDYYSKKKYDVRLIRSPDEFVVMKQINTNVHTFLVFDDIFGHFSPSPKEYFSYRHLFDDICALFPNEHSNNPDNNGDHNVKVLFNCRTNVFNGTEPQIQHGLFGVTYSLNRDFKFDVEEKKSIFNAHLEKCKLAVSDTDLDKVARHEYNTLGFPLICEMYTRQRKAMLDNVDTFFSAPLKYLIKILNELFRAEESSTSAAFLVLLMLNNGNIVKANLLDDNKYSELGIEKLQRAVDDLTMNKYLPTKLADAADTMIDTYLMKEQHTFMFSHPTIYDAVAFVIGKKDPVFILENCSLPFIVERVEIESDTAGGDLTDQELLIKLEPTYTERLLKRLAEEINEETMPLVLSHRSLRGGDRFRDFIRILQKSDKLLQVLHFRDRADLKSFLFWAAYTGTWQEDFFNILHTELSDFEDAELIEACLGSCIVGNKVALEYVMDHIDSDMKAQLLTYKMQDTTETEGTRTPLRETPMAYPKRHTPSNDLLIHIMSIYGHSELVPIFLNVGANPNTTGGLGMTPLMYACYFGHLDLARILRDKGADTELKNDDCDNCLHLAVKTGKAEVVRYLLEELKMDPDARGRYNRTPLMYAGYDNHKDVLNILVENKAELNPPSTATNRDNVLHEAAYHGSTDVVEQLVKVMDVNTAGIKGRTPLMLACSNGHLDTVNALLQHGAKVDDISDYNGATCYHLASNGGNVDVLKVLQQQSKNKSCLDCKDNTNQTPLMYAVFHDKEEMSYYITEENSSFDQDYNRFGATCLHLAAQSGNLDLLKFFLKRGLDKKKKRPKDWSPIIFAIRHGQFETFQYLANKYRWLLDDTCLKHACYGGNIHIVTTLMDKEAINDPDTIGLLHAACESGNNDLVKFLMKRFNVRPVNSCLEYASRNGNTNTVKMLMTMKCNINYQNNQGYTPVMLACKWGHMYLVKYLIDAGALWKDVYDRKGNSIVHLAAMGNNSDILEYLIEKVGEASVIRDLSVFHTACEFSAPRTAEILLRLGCSVDEPLPDRDCTPLMLPLLKPLKNSQDMVLTLVQHDADINARNMLGDTCFHVAASKNENIFSARLFLEAGMNVNVANRVGFTPLMVAALCGQENMFKFLLDHKADIWMRDDRGASVLHIACSSERESVPIILTLVDLSMPINLRDNIGRTPRMYCWPGTQEEAVMESMEENS